MSSLLPIVSLLLTIVVSLIVVRVATHALVLTGLSQQLARFQARSAFTGAGFTTSESEKVAKHPVRRRIIMLLMLLGNAGIVTAVSSLMLSFVETGEGVTGTLTFRILAMVVGVTILWLIARSPWIDRRTTETIEWALKRWTDLEVRDYSSLLHLSRGYAVVEFSVEEGDWLARRRLKELKLPDEGVVVLGIQRSSDEYVGAPLGRTELVPGDVLILYGPKEILENLDRRRQGSAGNWDHHKAVDKQREKEAEESLMHEASPQEQGIE
ncbi:TrkA-C domain protein [Planctomycetes bacterium Pan216]|uniref:TrkA-C domain protein n=1 Tax=Kolteria novifilia TaxID=2527975 RepID=A0A518B4V5_9BACT|nr:TrkA-C domain protein [Planctomycetes bacterium Pan216]